MKAANRIAYVCADPGVPVFGPKGCTVHVQEVLRAMLQSGARVDVFATRWDGLAPADLRGARCHELPPAPKGGPTDRELKCLASNEALREALDQCGPFDLVYERYSLWSYAAMEWAHDRNVPGILEVNAPLIDEQATYRGLVHRDEARHVAERAFGGATLLAPVSNGMAEYLRGFGVEAGRIHIMPNGVNSSRFRPDVPPALPAEAGTFTVGFVGNLKPWHGVSQLIEAFDLLHRRHPATRLLIVGEGPERPAVERKLDVRDLRHAAVLTGRVPNETVPAWVRSMDVATAPYPATEPDTFYFSPLKLYEYMAAGVPIVASRIGQVEEAVDHRRTGLLVDPGDTEALARAIEELLLDVPLRCRVGSNATLEAERHHSWTARIDRVIELAMNSHNRNGGPGVYDVAVAPARGADN
jgi:glycosyltransferase involved in cell wall biosynthesis